MVYQLPSLPVQHMYSTCTAVSLLLHFNNKLLLISFNSYNLVFQMCVLDALSTNSTNDTPTARGFDPDLPGNLVKEIRDHFCS